jgi:hypothetical protein
MNPEGGFFTYSGNYVLTGDDLFITLRPECAEFPEYDRFFGWQDEKRKFRIEEKSSSGMQLVYNDVHYFFRKY